jgi:hypothetical protein
MESKLLTVQAENARLRQEVEMGEIRVGRLEEELRLYGDDMN